MERDELRRDSKTWEHYRPSRANTRGVLAYVPASWHAELARWAGAHGVSMGAIAREAIVAFAQEHGIPLEETSQETPARSA